jgi:hypothetical protein
MVMAVALAMVTTNQDLPQRKCLHSKRCTPGDPSLATFLTCLSRPVVVSCGDKFTMLIVEPQSLPELEPPRTIELNSQGFYCLGTSSVRGYVDNHLLSRDPSEPLTGSDNLLCLLSLMERSVRAKKNDLPLDGDNKSSQMIGSPYSVDVSTLTFESLYSLVEIQTNALLDSHLLEKNLLGVDWQSLDSQQIDPSKRSRITSWSIVRTALQLLRCNLETLMDIVSVEFPTPSIASYSETTTESLDPLLLGLNNSVADGSLVHTLHTVSSADRLAAILTNSGEDRDARSSEDEGEEDEDEDDDDDDDDEDDDDDSDDDDDEGDDDEDDDYERYAQQMEELEEGKGDADAEDESDDFDVGKGAFAEDEGAEDDLGLNTPGPSNYHHHDLLSPRRRLSLEEERLSADEIFSPQDGQGNNESDSEDQFSPSKLENLFQSNPSLGMSPGVASDDDVEDLIRVDGHHSPALSNTSVDLSHHRMEYDSSSMTDRVSLSDKIDSLRSEDDQDGRIQYPLCGDNEEEDEDLQKAIYSSIDGSGRLSGQSLFKRKLMSNSVEILSVLSGRLEDVSRKYYDAILFSMKEHRAQDVSAFYCLWENIQEVIGKGFPLMYSLLDQREILLTILRDPSDLLHMVIGVAMGLRSERLVFVLHDLFDPKQINSPRSRGDEMTKPISLTLVDVAGMIQRLKSIRLCVSQVGEDILDNGPAMTQQILGATLEIAQSLLASILFRRLGHGSKSEDPSPTASSSEFLEFFRLLVESVTMELSEIVEILPRFGESFSSHINSLLRTTITSTVLSRVGGIFTNTCYFHFETSFIFLPFALRLMSQFQSFSTACRQLACLPIGKVVAEWIHTELRWILLFLSSMIGVCMRTGMEGNANDEKHKISQAYEPCSLSLFAPEEFWKQSTHPIWNRIPAPLKGWKAVLDSETLAHQNIKSITLPLALSPSWRQVIESLSNVSPGVVITCEKSSTLWFRKLLCLISKEMVNYLGGNTSRLLFLLQLEETYLPTLLQWGDEIITEPHNQILQQALIHLKASLFALVVIISGHHHHIDETTDILSFGLVDCWIAMAVIVSTLLTLDESNRLDRVQKGMVSLFFAFAFSPILSHPTNCVALAFTSSMHLVIIQLGSIHKTVLF